MMLQEPQTKRADGQSLQTDPIKDNGPLSVGQEAKGPGRLLIVEDARCTQMTIRLFLKKMNVTAETVENGKMACEMAEKSQAEGNPYDLILMDMQMPQMNGYEATRWLRKHGWEGPIVAVTAYTTAKDREKCVEAGCNDHLSKPITEMGLRNVIAQYLSGTVVNRSAETAG